MSHSVRKFVAVLLALWLPLFSGSVMAASVAMQLDMATSHHRASDAADEGATMDMSHCEMSAAADDLEEHPAAPDQPHHQCSACGICHLACSGYLAVSALNGLSIQQAGSAPVGYLLSFESVTSIPLLPPPLVQI